MIPTSLPVLPNLPGPQEKPKTYIIEPDNLYQKTILRILTFVETCRHQHLNIYMKLDIESDLLVEKTSLLSLENIIYLQR